MAQLRRQIVSNDHTSIIHEPERARAFHDCVFAPLSLTSFRLRRPTSYGEQFRARRASDEGKMYSRVSNLRFAGLVETREGGRRGGGGVRGEGLVGTGGARCAQLYYGNYMINTTRALGALSSPSRSSFQSRSSARRVFSSRRQESRSSRDFDFLVRRPFPLLFLHSRIVAPLIHPTTLVLPCLPLVQLRRRFHERALAVCLKIRSSPLSLSLARARNAINLIPFRSRLLSRRLSQRDE